SPDMALLLVVGGSHLAAQYGRTIDAIRADGVEIAATVDMTPATDSGVATAEAMGRGVTGFARAFADLAPDLAVVLGDRFEMLSAALAALPQRIPLAHIHGGELTEGALDDSIRHALTKLSHLHFVSTQEYARRVISLGEEPWRVVVSGAPALDNLRETPLMTREELDRAYGLRAGRSFLLMTYHPVTLEHERTAERVDAVCRAIARADLPVVVTYPNADMGSAAIIERIQAFAATRPDVRIATNLGTRGYFSMMAHAAAMVGNSSSGIIEAASFRLPVVNVGDRQQGRVRGANVLDCEPDEAAIDAAIGRALAPGFRESLRDLRNPYGDGNAADRIVSTLATIPFDGRLLRKRFHEDTRTSATAAGVDVARPAAAGRA
ncbi:MAG: UDP-N-acetylglucosamine 2-epimerase, partial [Longimicrobiales bacterium]